MGQLEKILWQAQCIGKRGVDFVAPHGGRVGGQSA